MACVDRADIHIDSRLEYFSESLLWIIENFQNSSPDEPYFVRNVFEKISIVRDDETGSIEIFEHVLDDIFRVEIEVIGRLIHDDDVWFCEKHFRECYLCSFSSRKSFDALIDFFSWDEKSAEHRSDFDVFRMIFREFCDDRLLSIEVRKYLRIWSDNEVRIDKNFSRKRWKLS